MRTKIQTDGQKDSRDEAFSGFRNFSNAPKNDLNVQVWDFSLQHVGKLLCSGIWLCVTGWLVTDTS